MGLTTTVGQALGDGFRLAAEHIWIDYVIGMLALGIDNTSVSRVLLFKQMWSKE